MFAIATTSKSLYYGASRSCNDDYCPSIDEMVSKFHLLSLTADPVLEAYDAALELSCYHDEVMSRRLSDDDEHSLFDDDEDDTSDWDCDMDWDPDSPSNAKTLCFWGEDCPKCAAYDGPPKAIYCFGCFNCKKPMTDHEGFIDEPNGRCCNLCAVKLYDSPEDEVESLKRPHDATQEDSDDGYDSEEHDEQYNKRHKLECDTYAITIEMDVDTSPDNSESTNDALVRLEMDNQRLKTLLEEQTRRTWIEYPENHHLTVSYENGKRYVMVCPSSSSQYGSGLTLDDLSPDFV